MIFKGLPFSADKLHVEPVLLCIASLFELRLNISSWSLMRLELFFKDGSLTGELLKSDESSLGRSAWLSSPLSDLNVADDPECWLGKFVGLKVAKYF